MSSTRVKVRFVRCPKCWGILPELPDVPVYRCGGCNATLKAKNRKEDGNIVSSDNPASKDEPKLETEIKDFDVFSRKDNLSSEMTSNQIESDECQREQCENSSSHEISSSGEINSHEKEESSSETGGDSTKVGHDNGGYFDSRSQSPDAQLFSRGSSPAYTVQRSYKDNNSFSSREPETWANIEAQGTRREEPTDTMQFADPKIYNEDSDEQSDDAQISGRHVGVIQSSATRNSNAYDGSVSSYDGWDDQVSDRHQYQCRPPLLESSNERRPTREDLRVTNKTNAMVEEHNQAIKFSSMLLNEHSSSTRRDDAQLDPIRYDVQAHQRSNSCGSEGLHLAPHVKVFGREDFLRKEHLRRDFNAAAHDHLGHSKYGHKEFMYNSSLNNEELGYVECDPIELLRKVDELREQLNKSYGHRQQTATENFPDRYSRRENLQPLYRNHNLKSDQENIQSYNASYSQQPPGSFRPRKSMTTHHYGCSRRPFSGTFTNCTHHAEHSHSHSCYEDSRYLRSLEQPSVFCEGGLHGARRGNMCFDPCSSSSSSPCRQKHSNCPCQVCDLQPITHHSTEMAYEVEKFHHKERRQAMKRHYRPIAGGAPFITCYSCSELLHVPADFLLTSKKCHKLQCGSCSKVLKFSLHKRIHIVPYSPKPLLTPPPSEIGDSHAAIGMRNSTHVRNCTHGEPLSYSEDYGLSTCKSCSTESEVAFVSPGGTAVDHMQPYSNGSNKVTEEIRKRSVLSHPEGKQKSPMEAQIFVGSSSNEIGSPLHRLMGYSSPSEVITG
ncbi:hypothetical protein Sjap_014381 [Stephania japonica]|uniref:Zinc-ribbon domain-containing protein n=1 Tax=Stephania japonica TaxID=461633 RepID=A0AAP0NZX6_9MAGN